ncbi:MAG TPA: hypothetical protein PLS10_07155 [Chitinophagales bacterium]|nr:hypothetical protein [Chitinophagales bacterium]
MQLSEEQLKEVEEYAALLFTPSEIAIILEVNEIGFIEELKNNESGVYKAFYKGILTTQIKLRNTELKFALKGNQTCLDRFEALITKLNKILP